MEKGQWVKNEMDPPSATLLLRLAASQDCFYLPEKKIREKILTKGCHVWFGALSTSHIRFMLPIWLVPESLYLGLIMTRTVRCKISGFSAEELFTAHAAQPERSQLLVTERITHCCTSSWRLPQKDVCRYLPVLLGGFAVALTH